MPKDDDLLPKKKASSAARTAPSSAKSGRASPGMRRLMRIARALGIVLGGAVTLVGAMALVGLVTDNFWIRLLLALLLVVGLPAFLSDRVLKRTGTGGGLSTVGDVFAILLLGVALLLVAAEFASRPLLVREGDRYARSGSRTTARVVYFLGGVSATFPEEKGTAPRGSASGAASAPAGSAR